MGKYGQKQVSVLLAVVLVISSLLVGAGPVGQGGSIGQSGLSLGESGDETAAGGGVITAFAALEQTAIVAGLNVPREELGLPAELMATVEKEGETAVPVEDWASEPAYLPQVAGQYRFTPVFAAEWTVAEGVELPAVLVATGGFQLFSIVGGVGTKENPLLIDSGRSLAEVAAAWNGGTLQTMLGGVTEVHIKLTADLDLKGLGDADGWVPFGTENTPFSGSFDGDGHRVKNLVINRNAYYQGLFGYVDGAEIRDLALEVRLDNVYQYAGSLVGWVEDSAIARVTVSGSVTGSNSSTYISGIAGRAANNTTIADCVNESDVQGNAIVGGVAGSLNDDSRITGSVNRGAVTVTSTNSAGGIAGALGSTAAVSHCVNEGAVTGTNWNSGNTGIGGIAGQVNGGTVENCLNRGGVTGRNALGGIVGNLNNSTVRGCINTGTVHDSGSQSAGGVVGRLRGGSMVENTASLGQKVESGGSVGRIAASLESGSISGSYAWEGMHVNGGTVTGNDPATANGAAMTATNAGSAEYWKGTVGLSDNDWVLADGKLPVPIGVDADDTLPVWLGGGLSGSGTVDDPFRIYTVADLTWLAEEVNNNGNTFANEHFRLMNGLDLDGVDPNGDGTGWVPIGKDYNNSFSGHFDGNGQVIEKLTINQNAMLQGLFGVIRDAEIYDLTLADVDISVNHNYTSGLAGQAYSSTIRGVTVTGSVTGFGLTGGVVGYAGSSFLSDCVNESDVTGGAAGGIAGGLSGSKISGSLNRGAVTVTNSTGNGGGIAGSLQDDSTVFGSVNEGAVHSTAVSDSRGNNGIGGIAGSVGSGSLVENSLNQGDVSGWNDMGGVAGHVTGTGTVQNCVSTGAVKNNGSLATGGIVGWVQSGGKVENVAALGKNVDGSGTVSARVVGQLDGALTGDLTGGYAWEWMLKNGSALPVGQDPTDRNGANMIAANANSADYWKTTISLSDSAWMLADGRLPVPVGTGADDSMPDWLRVGSGLPGSGTEDDPWRIYTVADLTWLAEKVNGGNPFDGEYFKLMNGQDLAGAGDGNGWVPIGNWDNPFSGHFDGNGQVIENLTINRNSSICQGLFGAMKGAEISDLTLEGAVVSGNNYTGGLAGRAEGGAIRRVTVSAAVSGAGDAGGVAGYVLGTTIEDCTAQGSVSSSSSSAGAGGIAGYAGSDATIENCTSLCTVTGNGRAGGIAGRLQSATVTGSVNRGTVTVTSNDAYAGGVAGSLADGTITHSVNEGAVTSTAAADGYTGYGIGGIAGRLSAGGAVEHCLNRGTVTGRVSVGGVAGYLATSASVKNSVSTGSVANSGSYPTGGVVGRAVSGSIVENVAALSQTVSGDDAVSARVVGQLESGGISNSYAWAGMLVNGSIPTEGIEETKKNGANMTAANAGSADYWENNIGLDGTDWQLADGKLPVPAGVAADDGLPLWLVDFPVGDIDLQLTAAPAVIGPAGGEVTFTATHGDTTFPEKVWERSGLPAGWTWTQTGDQATVIVPANQHYGEYTVTVSMKENQAISAAASFVVKMAPGGVTITGSTGSDYAKVGDVLMALPDAIPAADAATVYQWYRSGTAIVGAVGNTYTAVAADQGKTLTVQVGHPHYYGEAVSAGLDVHTDVTGVSLNHTALALNPSQTQQLTATITPTTASEQGVTWSSEPQAVATVSDTGLVTAISNGRAKITVTTLDGGETAECVVTVTTPVEGVSLDKSSITLVVGDAEQLTATVLPNTASDKNVDWSSGDESIASVDGDGKVTAHKAGNTTITVTTVEGGKTAACTVAVIDVPSAPTGVSAEAGDGQASVSFTPPADTGNSAITGYTVTAYSGGVASGQTATGTQSPITVTGLDNGTSYTFTVTATNGAGNGPESAESNSATPRRAVTGVSLDEEDITLVVGGTYQLTATVEPSGATNPSVTWSSIDDAIASVDIDGKVTAHKAGNTTITVTTADSGKTAACTVAVIDVPGAPIDVSAAPGDEEATVSFTPPTDTGNSTITGYTVTAYSGGVAGGQTATGTQSPITVTGLDNGTSYTFTVTATNGAGNGPASAPSTPVTPRRAVTGVSLNNENIALVVGGTEQLIVTISPSDATYQGVTWRTNDPAIATVSDSGLVTAVGNGQTKITVATDDGNYTADCVVTVTTPVTGVSVSPDALTLYEGGVPVKLIAVVEPADASNQVVTWSSSAPAIAAVDQAGTVTPLREGSAVITVTTEDGGLEAFCRVTVEEKPVTVIPVTGVSLDKETLELTEGGRGALAATVEPADADDKAVTWQSSDSATVSVDGFGSLTAHKAGSAVITVRTVDGGFTATCTVTVQEREPDDVRVTDIALDNTSLVLTKGETAALTATVSPADATDKTVFWSSSDANVAEVDENGRVTARGAGTATITATTADGGFTAACTVTVKSAAPSHGKSSSKDRGRGPDRYTLALRWIDQAELAHLLAEAQAKGLGRVGLRGLSPTGIRAGALALGGDIPLVFDSVEDYKVQVRLKLAHPGQAEQDLLLTGWVTGSEVERVQALFAKWFQGEIRVVHFQQNGAWGQEARVAAAVDLDGMDAANLAFYHYDREANAYRRIPNPDYRVDANGYLWFTTEYAGDIIIVEGVLVKRERKS